MSVVFYLKGITAIFTLKKREREGVVCCVRKSLSSFVPCDLHREVVKLENVTKAHQG